MADHAEPMSSEAIGSHHPLIRSYDARKDWWYCYVYDLAFGGPDAPWVAHS